MSLSECIPLHEDKLALSSSWDASSFSGADFFVARSLNFFLVGVQDRNVRDGPVGGMEILMKTCSRGIRWFGCVPIAA